MAVGGSSFSSDDIVVKSPNDKRLYRYIQLPNGLCVLLIHDPEIYSDGQPKTGAPYGNIDEDDDDEDDDDEDDEEDDNETGDDDEDDERESASNAAQCKKV